MKYNANIFVQKTSLGEIQNRENLMQFNPLFLPSNNFAGNTANPKAFKLSGSSYLFSDIIKVFAGTDLSKNTAGGLTLPQLDLSKTTSEENALSIKLDQNQLTGLKSIIDLINKLNIGSPQDKIPGNDSSSPETSIQKYITIGELKELLGGIISVEGENKESSKDSLKDNSGKNKDDINDKTKSLISGIINLLNTNTPAVINIIGKDETLKLELVKAKPENISEEPDFTNIEEAVAKQTTSENKANPDLFVKTNNADFIDESVKTVSVQKEDKIVDPADETELLSKSKSEAVKIDNENNNSQEIESGKPGTKVNDKTQKSLDFVSSLKLNNNSDNDNIYKLKFELTRPEESSQEVNSSNMKNLFGIKNNLKNNIDELNILDKGGFAKNAKGKLNNIKIVENKSQEISNSVKIENQKTLQSKQNITDTEDISPKSAAGKTDVDKSAEKQVVKIDNEKINIKVTEDNNIKKIKNYNETTNKKELQQAAKNVDGIAYGEDVTKTIFDETNNQEKNIKKPGNNFTSGSSTENKLNILVDDSNAKVDENKIGDKSKVEDKPDIKAQPENEKSRDIKIQVKTENDYKESADVQKSENSDKPANQQNFQSQNDAKIINKNNIIVNSNEITANQTTSQQDDNSVKKDDAKTQNINQQDTTFKPQAPNNIETDNTIKNNLVDNSHEISSSDGSTNNGQNTAGDSNDENKFSQNKNENPFSSYFNKNDIGNIQSIGKPEFVDNFGNQMKKINASDIVKEISKLASDRDQKSVILKLVPEDLGKVKISLDISNNIIHAHAEVENETAKSLLQNNLNALKQSLVQQGLQLSSLNISLSNNQEQKSNKSYSPKRKFTYQEQIREIGEQEHQVVSKNYGYNTYEFLA
jgi:flagellar hook-length control protein FliK